MKPIPGIQPPLRPASLFADYVGKQQQTERSNPVASPGIDQAQGIDGFANLLVEQVQSVNNMQTDANDMVHSMLTGGDVNEAEVLTAVQKADLAFRMLLQVRNKLIEAYREVQQIQI